MKKLLLRSTLVVGMAFAISGGAITVAWAQSGGTSGIPNREGPGARPVVAPTPDSVLPGRVPRAVGLPGAQSDAERVAPADRPASEMRPTEALFDAINRGDITAARDAISRGAEMNGRSILGFTPVEMAVDLGRKDIAFLLLSLRGTEGRPEPRGARPAAATAQSEAQQTRAAKLEAQREAQRAEAARRAAARVAPSQGPVVPQGPRLFAGDGGAPVPDAGFMGFGGGGGGSGRTR